MKTEAQILHLVSQMSFRSNMDWEMIELFCSQKLKTTLPEKFSVSDDGLDVVTFQQWYENGIGAGSVAVVDNPGSELHDCLIIVGKCDLKIAKIEGFIQNGEVFTKRSESPMSYLKLATPEQCHDFIAALSKQGLQYLESNNLLIEKHYPHINERVLFYNEQRRGLGVVKSVDIEKDEVELYCYYIYNTGEIGYSMYEKGICSVHNYFFEAMNVSAQRRLNRELNKAGKLWNEKKHRIEPIEGKVSVGEKYWYINDKMKVVQEVEKGTPTSNFRYLAANYFKSRDECVDYAREISEMLRDRLAKPESPIGAI